MSPSGQPNEVCSICGGRRETTTPGVLSCLPCLLRMGLEEANSTETTASGLPDSFGGYVIARREDGSLTELGRGAMGITFLAEDVSLQRPVALKVIETEFARSGSAARERFMREARAAAALRHPNVATVYQFGMDDETGQYFYAMELLEGETLEERVQRTGPLDVSTTVKIARQVTAALVAAEERGLVHRDLKPANLMMTTGGIVKVIDFGVAKALMAAPAGPNLTQGGFIGTPAFASPEQLAAAPIDVRSDIYSLGATLFYLLTGRSPLGTGGRSGQQTGANFAPVAVAQLKAAHVPSSLGKLLVSMLAFEPSARPSTHRLASRLEEIESQADDSGKLWRRLAIAAVFCALAAGGTWSFYRSSMRLATPPKNPSEKSIAVLPLQNLSTGKDGDFLVAGLQDEILTNLARLADLKVISSSSVQQYASSSARNLPQIAHDLGVAYVLTGGVKRTGDGLRVSLELTDARNDAHLWSHTYERKAADVFAMESEIARTVADQLQAKLSPGENAAINRPPTSSMAAYALYVRARQVLLDPGSDPENPTPDQDKAEKLLTEAIRDDPNFVLAYCELADIYDERYWDQGHSPDWLKRADAAIETATRLAPDLGEVHLARGIHFYHGYRQYGWARAEFALAREKLPNEPRVYSNIGYLDRREGHWEDAEKNLRHVFELNPASMDARFELADLYMSLAKFKEMRALLGPVPATGIWGDVKSSYFADADFLEKGDMTSRMAITPAKKPDGSVPFWNLKHAVYARDADLADKVLAGLPQDYFGDGHTLLYWKGAAAQVRGDRASMIQFYGKARAAAAKASAADPNDAALWGDLGLFDAILGNKEEALKEGRRAVELLPLEKDSVRGMELAVNLAYIYGWVGEKDQALAQIQRLMKIPRGPRYGHLRYYPQYDPLRSDPRFQEILASVAPKDTSSR